MKKTYTFLIVIFNLLLIYLFVFSSARNEDLVIQLDNNIDGYILKVEMNDNEISSLFAIADEHEMALVFKKINYSGLISHDYEYDIYNFGLIKDEIKYLGDNEIISVSPFSKQKINEIGENYHPNSSISIFTENIEPLMQYFNELERHYNIYEINEFNIYVVNAIANGRIVIAFIGLLSVSIVFMLLSRSKELAMHFVQGKNDIEIIGYQFMRILKIHLLVLVFINLLPIAYLVSLSVEHLFSFIPYIFVANFIFILIYFLINYITIPLIIKTNSILSLLKGKKILGASLHVLRFICIFLMILTLFSANKVSDNFYKAYFYYNITNEKKVDDLYTFQGSSIGIGNELNYEENVDIVSRIHFIEYNEYLASNVESYFDYDKMRLKKIFTEDINKNYRYLNSNMFNLLEVKDINGKIVTNDGKTTIYVPESKYDQVKNRYQNIDNFVKIEDNQEIFIPMDATIEHYYSIDAYYIVEEANIDKEMIDDGFNIYEPGQVNMFFTKDDVEYLQGKYFSSFNITSIHSNFLSDMEEEWILYINIINSTLILLITFIVSSIVYYRALFKKYNQLLLVNLINGNSIFPIILLKNMLLNIALLIILICMFIFGNYLWIVIILIQILIILLEYRRILRSDYISEIKGEV